MKTIQNAHLTYCTNIHPGETWPAVFDSLKKHLLEVKKQLAPNQEFGIGLRLSAKSAVEILENNHLETFKTWLDSHQLYVFTMNGFPYGDFHDTVIKDKVHLPDWTTKERVDYTKNLIDILSYLLPEGMEGGISTSPISYKPWFTSDKVLKEVIIEGIKAMVEIAHKLYQLRKETGKLIHIDIEPEPDGLMDKTVEVLDFYQNYLLQPEIGLKQFKDKTGLDEVEAKQAILDHIQVCYDVCHFALVFEEPASVIAQFEAAGIKIGKIQISAALKAILKDDNKNLLKNSLAQFNEPSYLHQATIKTTENNLQFYTDLEDGISAMDQDNFEELRTHFHVPIFVDQFEALHSTQDEIIKALNIWVNHPYTQHLEVETYTWGVLPQDLQVDLTTSIARELQWVLGQLNS